MEDMDRSSARVMVMTALMAALTCVATMVIHIASPTGGYLNLGDAVVLLSAYLLGPLYGALAAGIGSMLADLLSAAAIYAPATLVIKAAMALTAALLYGRFRTRTGGIVLCGAAGEALMVAGYWLYDAFLLRSLIGSAAGIPSNLVQAAFGIAASTLLALALRRSPYVHREFPRL
jgi:uncharacterized membrane protein